MQVSQKSSETALREDLRMIQNRVPVEMDCRIIDTAKVVASSQARASSLDDGGDGAVVVDGQGNLDKEAQIAEKAAGRLVEEFRRAGVIE